MLINNSEINLGLSSKEVSERIASGYVNKINSNTKKIKQIFKENLFTFFNILNLVFALLIIFTGTYSNLLFLLVVVFNLIIGIIQELTAKIKLDRLSLLIMNQ